MFCEILFFPSDIVSVSFRFVKKGMLWNFASTVLLPSGGMLEKTISWLIGSRFEELIDIFFLYIILLPMLFNFIFPTIGRPDM